MIVKLIRWRFVAVTMLCLMTALFAQEKQQKIDKRIWSQSYWQKMAKRGLVPVAENKPLSKARFTGSQLDALSTRYADSPDVLILDPGITPSTTTQSENSIFVHPLDNTIVLNSNNSTDNPVSGVFGADGLRSTDAGLSWAGQITGVGGNNSGDPAAVIGLNGNYYVGYIAADGGMGVARSTDGGVTWTHVQIGAAPGGFFDGLDKNHLWVDNSPVSPHEGNLYAAWTRFETGSPNDGQVEVVYSTDDGLTWSAPVEVSSALTGFKQGVNIQTASDGTVYVTYTVYLSGGVEDEPAYGMAISSDGGATWTTGQFVIQNTRGIRFTEVGKSGIRVNSFPSTAVDISGGPRDGTIYMVWPNIGVPGVNTGTDVDIYLIRSADGGATWSTPIRVNQDPSGLGKKHFMSWVTCDPQTGNLSVIYYDDRNVGSLETEVYVSNSFDGGDTWDDTKVSDVSFTPAPIAGLAGGYFGDYLSISARGGRVYPAWTDNRSGNALTYTSPFILADLDDPNAPSGVQAFSDFNTPTSIALSWTDPVSLVDGTPFDTSDFTIEIERDGVFIASLPGGTESLVDTGITVTQRALIDGQLYKYSLFTKLIANDSTSFAVSASAYAGGSPTPAAPTNLVCTGDTVNGVLTWSDPVAQDDGTPLDDLDSIRVYRNGSWIGSAAAGAEMFIDTPPPGFTYTYTVTAVDNETPVNESLPSNAADCYVGNTPAFLVWVGPDAGGGAIASGDSLLSALSANGESAFLTNDLFEFGSDLSIYEGVFVVLGIFSNNHLIGGGDPEGPALETYLQNGGRLYLEAGDAFNFDPEFGGYNIRPWFGVDDGPDGSADVDSINGVNDLSPFSFVYNGDDNFMDELQPVSSTPIWLNPGNGDISGVFNVNFGTGRAFGVVPAFGGLVNSATVLNTKNRVLTDWDRVTDFSDAAKSVSEKERNSDFVKKAVFPKKKAPRKSLDELVKLTENGYQILANNKTELMAAYLALFRSGLVLPEITVAPTSISDTLLVNGSETHIISITNTGGTLAGDLTFSIVENPVESWISVSPDTGTVSANQTLGVAVTLDATGLAPNLYATVLEITSNDPNTPLINVTVEMQVNEAPVLRFTPDSMAFTLDPLQQDSAALIIINDGTGPLEFTLEPTINALASLTRPGTAKVPDAQLSAEMRREIQRRRSHSNPDQPVDETAAQQSQRAGLPRWGYQGEEIFGSTANAFSGTNRDRGNIISVNKNTTLLEYKQYLDIPTSTELYLFVYEGDSVVGNFTKIFEVRFANSGTGEGFYSTGSINLPLKNGKDYYLGASWGNVDVTYFRGDETTPIPASFGALETGIPSTTAGFPPAPTANNTFEGFSPYFCAINTGAGFLTVSPKTGTVQPGDSATAQVMVKSEKLLAGDFFGGINILSNDPLSPAVTLPVTLTVTAAPVIDLSPDTLTFDSLLVGESQSLPVEIFNNGSSDLSVSNISSDNPVFTADPTSLLVEPLSSEPATITFTPDAAGDISGYMVFASDDPLTPLDSIYITGVAIAAPLASISPDSFFQTLEIGQISTDTLTIINDGNGPLEYSISFEGTAKNAKVDIISDGRKLDEHVIASGKRLPLSKIKHAQRFIFANAQGQPDINASFVRKNSGSSPPVIAGEEIFGSTQNVFGPGGLRGRGNLFTSTTTRALDEHWFYLNFGVPSDMYFVVAESDVQAGIYTTISVSQVLAAGPGEGWYSSGPVDVTLREGKFYLIFAQWVENGNYYNEQNIAPYPIPTSFGELTAGAGWSVGSIPTYADPPATTHQIDATAFGDPVAYFQALVTSSPVEWLSADSAEGIVLPGSSLDVILTFDPSGLPGGEYDADIAVTTNDPLNPELRAHAHLTLLGEPGIDVDPVIFPDPVFVNGTDSTEMRIKNTGNGVLSISGIASDNPVFNAAQTPFDISPFDSAAVMVFFSPDSEGAQTGKLTINSNDPLNPAFQVDVAANAVPAPVIAVVPDSISEVLNLDDSTDVAVTIENTGGSDLLWSVETVLGKTAFHFPEMKAGAQFSESLEAAQPVNSDLGEMTRPTRVSSTPWDVQYSYDATAATGAGGNAGAEFDGTYFYTTRWASNLIHKYDINGNLVEEFSIPGVTGLRDLAFDGVYMYGGNAQNLIYQMDFDAKTLIGTINTPQPVRNIAYNPDEDAFFVANWSTDIALVDRSGNTVYTIPAATHQNSGVYGSAYDNVSPGGPYLWVFDQNGTTSNPPVQQPNTIRQLSLPSGQPTGFEYDVLTDFSSPDIVLAGGLFMTDQIVPGKITMGGLIQGTPDLLFGYELTDANSANFMEIIGETAGSVAPGQTGGFTLRLHALTNDTTLVGGLDIFSNDPVSSVVTVPVELRVSLVGIEDEALLPTTYAVSANYPNPFNPSTSMDFQLPQISNVQLVIFNVLGQKVRTLVNEQMGPGRYKAIWDARNDAGQPVASGIYIYRFSAESTGGNNAARFENVQKMILLK